MSNYDPLDIQGQERTKAEKAALERVKAEVETADFKWLMGSKRGRRIVWRQLERTGVFRSSFNSHSMLMAFTEGNKNEGFRTLALIHAHCYELYSLMVKENTNDNRNTDDAG